MSYFEHRRKLKETITLYYLQEFLLCPFRNQVYIGEYIDKIIDRLYVDYF